MKYALRSWQSDRLLLEADEIIVWYNEREKILDYPEMYPNTAVTIQCWKEKPEDIDWNWCAAMAQQFTQGFTMGFMELSMLYTAQSKGIKAYLLKTVNSYVELNVLLQAGAAYVYLDQPLFSSIDKVKEFGIPARYIPNLIDSSPGLLTQLNRLSHGTWIRPEDIDMYDYGDCLVEFQGVSGPKAEKVYFDVYRRKEWLGRFNLLIPELENYNVDNFLLESELSEKRLNCHQRCEESPDGNGCHLCDSAFRLATRENIKGYMDDLNIK